MQAVACCVLLGAGPIGMAVASSFPEPPPDAPYRATWLTWSTPRDSLDALDELRRRIRYDRRDLEARRQLCHLLAPSENVEVRREAFDVLREALLIDETDPDLWIRMARLQERRGFRQEARKAYHTALENNPARADLWSELAYHQFRRYQQFDRDRFLAKALEANRKTLELDPEYPPALALGIRMAAILEHETRVDSLLTRWLRVEPDSPWARLIEGMRLADVQAWDRARDAFERALATLPVEERLAFESLELVDPNEEIRRMDSPDSIKYMVDYWRWHDPTPADPVNPRRLEHFRRMVEADLLFGLDYLGVHGWDHAPGEVLVRYGLPDWWRYDESIVQGDRHHLSSLVSLPARAVIFGQAIQPIVFNFIDYNLNGRYYHVIEAIPRAQDFMMAQNPSHYRAPFSAPELDQEIELWRFDGGDNERIEVVVALDPETWPESLLEEPYRLASQLTLYDTEWTIHDATVGSWAVFERDHLDRLVGIFTLASRTDSTIVGLETEDRHEIGRAAGFAALPPADGADALRVSDIAFLSGVRFDGQGGQYARAYGQGLPNPGHRYRARDQIGIAFETYHLQTGPDGRMDARLRITVGQATRKGILSRLLRIGQEPPEAELQFDVDETGSVMEQILAIEVPDMDRGRYTLRVEVEDRIAGTTAVRSAPFEVVGD